MSYHAYAGIGAQVTPGHILKIMHHIGAYLFSEGWTLRSGAAEGADTAFEEAVDQMASKVTPRLHGWVDPKKEIYLPWKGFNHSTSFFHPKEIPFSQVEMDFAAHHHPAWNKCSPSARLMMQRNTRQILGHPSVNGPIVVPVKFVVCWTEGGHLKGGTAQALRIAQACEIPIINLGKAKTAQELEALVLEVDRLQSEARKEGTST